ncbi:MAG: hypothetical protein GEV06_13970 [Luteitalea sp.]|nr:hypothetical protein [Luteitalea sp.]
MAWTLALRSLLAHPVRSAVLAGGFGLGVSVMATLLGIGSVILEQARAPALVGGGDVVIAGSSGRVSSARFILSSALETPPLAGRAVVAAPMARETLYLVRGDRRVAIRGRGGVPSLERALDDPETSPVRAWVDTPEDARWARPDPDDVLRAMDRFHPIPDVPARAASWAEWLYFNGHTEGARFYLTFLVGPRADDGRRIAAVRFQLQQGSRVANYSASQEVDEAGLLASAPELAIAGNNVRLQGSRYIVTIDLPREAAGGGPTSRPGGRGATASPRLTGRIVISATPGRSLPPISVRGAGGWVSGYTVPVMSGTLDGELQVGGDRIALSRGRGYHDHNWGFWEGVSWRWGQVQSGELSLVYGRIIPPPDAADADRAPGFLAVIGPNGPIASTTHVTIDEINHRAAREPERILVRGRGPSLDLTLDLEVEEAVITPMREGFFGAGLDFLQLRAQYRVTGRVDDRTISFAAPGSAETFRGR